MFRRLVTLLSVLGSVATDASVAADLPERLVSLGLR